MLLTVIPGREPTGYPVVSFAVTGIVELVSELPQWGVTFVEPAASTFADVPGRVEGHMADDYGLARIAILANCEGNVRDRRGTSGRQ